MLYVVLCVVAHVSCCGCDGWLSVWQLCVVIWELIQIDSVVVVSVGYRMGWGCPHIIAAAVVVHACKCALWQQLLRICCVLHSLCGFGSDFKQVWASD